MAAKQKEGEWHGMPKYVIAVAIIVAVAVILVVVSSASTGLRSCSGKVVQQARYSCYTYYADYYGNASICNYLSGQYRDECLYNVSTATSNSLPCSGISLPEYVASCVSSISLKLGSAAACSSLQEPYASSCAYGVAKASGFSNESVCASIQNSTLSDSCAASHYYNAALASRSASYCGYLSHSYDGVELSAIAANSTQEFGPVSAYNLTPFGYCYSMVALELNDRSMCSTLNGTDAASCQAYFTQSTGVNVTAIGRYCNQSGSQYPGIGGLCGAAITIYEALQSGNVTKCLTLNGSYIGTCVTDIARKYNDSSYCSYISNATEASACNVTVSGTR